MSIRLTAALLALAFVLACLALWPSPAAAESACLAVNHTYAKIDALIAEHGGKRETLEGKAARAYLDAVNSAPPVTHLASDFVVLWERDEMVAIGIRRDDGLVCPVGHINSTIHAKALKAALGEDT